ncbi:MAG: tRNA epoxyqueuosine(34) reductase QueG [Chloroflexi bacterium]|nr:tRNA epoxyqueuosine(34) reductase QueG [Chloroflexota bacterium]
MSLAQDLLCRAQELGFAAIGCGPATPLVDHEAILAERLASGALSAITYFRPERVPLAARPELLLLGARSVISLAWAYDGAQPLPPAGGSHGRVAAYARGLDYHRTIKAKLRSLTDYLREREPACRCRAFVDATPLLERALAQRAGLGWFGKNNCLIVPGRGSWILLAEVLTTAEVESCPPAEGGCGDCRACLDACPTGALVAPYQHLAGRCLSFLTVELRGPIPEALRPSLGDRVLGCDACQAACPQNMQLGSRQNPVGAGLRAGPVPTWPCGAGRAGHAPPLQSAAGHLTDLRRPSSGEVEGNADREPGGLPAWLELASLFDLAAAAFATRFGGTAGARPGRARLLRNAAVVLGNGGDRASVPILARALLDPEPLVRGHAAWALGRLGGRAARAALAAALRREGDDYVRGEQLGVLDRA